MRWKTPKMGDTRERRVFALLPITIDHDTRWLEWCRVSEYYGYVYYGMCEWIKVKFIDD